MTTPSKNPRKCYDLSDPPEFPFWASGSGCSIHPAIILRSPRLQRDVDCNGIVSPGTIAECKATGSKPSATAAGDAYTFGELGAMHREGGRPGGGTPCAEKPAYRGHRYRAVKPLEKAALARLPAPPGLPVP